MRGVLVVVGLEIACAEDFFELYLVNYNDIFVADSFEIVPIENDV